MTSWKHITVPLPATTINFKSKGYSETFELRRNFAFSFFFFFMVVITSLHLKPGGNGTQLKVYSSDHRR